jgi:hypothetical protein
MSTHTSPLPNLPRFSLPKFPDIPVPPAANTPFVGSVAYSATVTPDCDSFDIVNVGTLTGNVALATPTGTPNDGQTLIIRFKQDATGGRTYSTSAGYQFGATYALLSWTTTANAVCEAEFRYNAATAKWMHVGFANF